MPFGITEVSACYPRISWTTATARGRLAQLGYTEFEGGRPQIIPKYRQSKSRQNMTPSLHRRQSHALNQPRPAHPLVRHQRSSNG